MELATRELVRLYHWLADALWWQSRYDEVLRIGEEGLALLGNDTESVEAALMNSIVSAGHRDKGDLEKFREFNLRNVQFIQRLPYSEELRPAYFHIVLVYAYTDKNVEEAIKWIQALEQRAQRHHDLRALGDIHYLTAGLLVNNGDLRGAISQCQKALELSTKIGDAKNEIWCLIWAGSAFLSLGDLQKAAEYAYRGLKTAESVGSKRDQAWAYMPIGKVFLCQGSWEKAIDAFQKADQLLREHGWGGAPLLSGRAYLAQGERQEALRQFQEAIPSADALSGLEEAYDDPEEFRNFCRRFREERPEVGNLLLFQWFLEPAETVAFSQNLVHDEFETLSPSWRWFDQFGDCSFTLTHPLPSRERGTYGIEIHAANGRDLSNINLSAPRILQPVSGDFVVQTVCVLVSQSAVEKPAIGGILLWKDKENYLRLDIGTRGKHEISFGGCLANKDVIIGRGRLPSERVFLRLERLGRNVNALCSANGVEWFTVGHAEFPVEDPVEVGLHAIGNIDRTIYHGAFPEGTAIRFESFRLWGR